MQRDFTPDEISKIAMILADRADDLRNYTRWINDRPQLPEREVALKNVENEARCLQALAYYVKTDERLIPTHS